MVGRKDKKSSNYGFDAEEENKHDKETHHRKN
jgi:hypothetical protein